MYGGKIFLQHFLQEDFLCLVIYNSKKKTHTFTNRNVYADKTQEASSEKQNQYEAQFWTFPLEQRRKMSRRIQWERKITNVTLCFWFAPYPPSLNQANCTIEIDKKLKHFCKRWSCCQHVFVSQIICCCFNFFCSAKNVCSNFVFWLFWRYVHYEKREKAWSYHERYYDAKHCDVTEEIIWFMKSYEVAHTIQKIEKHESFNLPTK